MTTVGIPALPARLAERYEVGPVIGRGAGSAVFLAHDTLLGRDAAVKTFRVETDERARRELCLLASMDHPGLVPVYDVEEHDGRAFVVMALLDGGSLADRVGEHGAAAGGLSLPEALRTVATVACALDHIHRAGVLHRAVTPGNVLYDGDGRAHLSDFGVAFVADAPRITDTGLTVGAAPYLAPEQVRGEPAGAPADVYALGLVLIEALTGRRAFPGDPLSSAQARLDRGPAVPAGLPSAVAGLLADMTRDDPAARPDAAAVSVGLRQALVDAEPPTMPALLAGPGATTSGPAVRTGTPVARTSARDRRPAVPRRGAPRSTGTRGVLVLAGLAASAVLAGTVAIATSGPVAQIAESARPAAIVPGGATVGVPDPNALAAPPLALPPSSSGAAVPTSDPGAAEAVRATPPTSRSAAPHATSAATGSSVSRPSSRHTEATRTSAPTRDTDQDEGSDEDTGTARSRPEGAVGGVLRGVGGLVGGVLRGGH
jgi:eukaryotic-like serine/threonine-protein kinase